MAKPILIVKIPQETNDKHLNLIVDKLSKFEELNKEYHVLICTDNSEELAFEVLNSTNASDIDLEELKQTLLTNLKSKHAKR